MPDVVSPSNTTCSLRLNSALAHHLVERIAYLGREFSYFLWFRANISTNSEVRTFEFVERGNQQHGIHLKAWHETTDGIVCVFGGRRAISDTPNVQSQRVEQDNRLD